MRSIVNIATNLDGFIARENDELDWVLFFTVDYFIIMVVIFNTFLKDYYILPWDN
jgi:hypothetical protein